MSPAEAPTDHTVQNPGFGEWPGCYRGVVEDVDDVEVRRQYRVRCFHVHDDSIEVVNLPPAETISFDDPRPLDVGDLVWVMFEGGIVEFPVVIGRWLSHKDGIPDLTPEQTTDYNRHRKRWQRRDRWSLLELSEVPEEGHIRMRSGRAEIRVRRIDDGIEINTITGPVNIVGEKVNVRAREAVLRGGNVTVEADRQIPESVPGVPFPTPGVPSGVLNLFTNSIVNIYAGATPALDPASIMRIGQYTDGKLEARQTALVTISPSVLQLGSAVSAPPTSLPTILVNIDSSVKVAINAPLVELAGPGAIHPVVTTQTHPIDSFTGAPIVGTTRVLASGP